MTRRTFVGAVASASASVLYGDEGWIELFNGRTLDGWRPSENKASWKVAAGSLGDQLVAVKARQIG